MARNRREVAADLERQERRSASPKRGQRAASRHARAEVRGGGAAAAEEEAAEEGAAGGAGADAAGEAWPERTGETEGMVGTEVDGRPGRSASAGGRRRKRNHAS